MVIDKDPEAIAVAQARFGHDARVVIKHGSFSNLAAHLQSEGLGLIDGLLLDLGVSSNQIDVAARGFSFGREGPLDMRMGEGFGAFEIKEDSTSNVLPMDDMFMCGIEDLASSCQGLHF